MYSSMSQTDLKEHVMQNIHADELTQRNEAELVIEQLHK